MLSSEFIDEFTPNLGRTNCMYLEGISDLKRKVRSGYRSWADFEELNVVERWIEILTGIGNNEKENSSSTKFIVFFVFVFVLFDLSLNCMLDSTVDAQISM